MVTKAFGIRHHGPGSAQCLERALAAFQPEVILVEAPADAQSVIAQAATPGLELPAAIVIYNPLRLSQAVYLPFAEFSPEWRAIRFGLENKIPIRCIDLPMERYFAWQEAQSAAESADNSPRYYSDPLSKLACLAGYSDSERWWEIIFEQTENDTAIFTAILDMMTALREGRTEDSQTLLREAHMRNAIRNVKGNFDRVAVVCGAWHAPVLQHWQNFSKKEDDQRLRGIGKVKTAATWAPWSYQRLALHSGYGAGVISPAWYELLFQNRAEAAIAWMSNAARLLRTENIDTSSAEVIDAIRLAQTLATMRGYAVAGQDELQEAAATVLCKGDAALLELIKHRLIIGDRVGIVPSIIAPPLQQDLERQIKSLRLTSAYRSSEIAQKDLDLRIEQQRAVSHFLHRLRILDIPWGQPLEQSPYRQGSFKESWQLQWAPDFVMRLIEAGIWGMTIAEAAKNLVVHRAQQLDQLPALTALASEVLLADLPEAVSPLLQHLQNAVAVSHDVPHLMETLEPLVRIIRYGSVRQTDAALVRQLLDEIVPRICLGLPRAAQGIDEESATELARLMTSTNHQLALLNDLAHHHRWVHALSEMIKSSLVQPLLQGLSVRMLFDKNLLSVAEAGNRLQYALSAPDDAVACAQWLEGFLQGSGLLLIYHALLWQVLDHWVATIEPEYFEQVLPMLRRAFSRFGTAEREKMLQKAMSLPSEVPELPTDTLDASRAALVKPTVRLLLGIGEQPE